MKLSQALILAGVMIGAVIGGVVVEIRLQKGLDEALASSGVTNYVLVINQVGSANDFHEWVAETNAPFITAYTNSGFTCKRIEVNGTGFVVFADAANYYMTNHLDNCWLRFDLPPHSSITPYGRFNFGIEDL